MDQAQGLRELVAAGKVGSFEIVEHPDMPPGIAVMIQQWDGWHNGKYYHEGVESTPPTPNKAKLWDDLKAELERESVGVFRMTNERFNDTPESRMAKSFLDRMNQAEIFATHVRPANSQDFANVRTELKGEPHA